MVYRHGARNQRNPMVAYRCPVHGTSVGAVVGNGCSESRGATNVVLMTRPWTQFRITSRCARRASSLASSSAWLSSSAPITNPRTVWLDGKTDLHNYYPEAWRRADRIKGGSGCGGTYTTKRTSRTAKAVAHQHARLSKGQHTYLITHTMSDAADDRLRRRMFRRFLDRVRKLRNVAGMMWTTERHKRGQLHHHCVLRMFEPFDYTRYVVAWSMRYCGSPNGLDIAPPKWVPNHQTEEEAAMYAAKGFWYGIKGQGTDDELPFRWWGTSRIARKVECSQEDLPTLHTLASKNRWPKCAYVSARWATEMTALRTRGLEEARRLRRFAPP